MIMTNAVVVVVVVVVVVGVVVQGALLDNGHPVGGVA